jgi:stage II sporulation protein AA (anti-sigma F factor antagonist)
VVRLRGEHDAATAPALARALCRAARRHTDLVVDLRAVTFLDAASIDVLVAARDGARADGHTLSLRAPSRAARRVVTLCGLDDMIEPAVLATCGPCPAGA